MIVLIKKLFYNIWSRVWIFWSNIRWRNSRKDVPFQNGDKIKENETIEFYVKRISSMLLEMFNYKHDGPDQLYDTIPPPSEMYARYLENNYSDDCDGFHSGLSYFLHNSNIEHKILLIDSLHNSFAHCVLEYYDGKQWKVCDYDYQMTKEVAIEYYKDRCNGDFLVYDYEYDYSKNKFRFLSHRR